MTISALPSLEGVFRWIPTEAFSGYPLHFPVNKIYHAPLETTNPT